MVDRVMKINLDDVKNLIELLDSSSVAELEITQGEESLRLSRQSQVVTTVAAAPAPVAPAMPAVALDTPVAAPAPEVAGAPAISGHAIKSPMVGTFYQAASPDADAFVKVGQKVNVGDLVCIIEAMKTMNQIEADRSGVVKEIMVENATPVEYDQPLFMLEDA